MRRSEKSKVTPLFRSLDVSGQGRVTKQQVQDLLRKAGIGCGDARVAGFMNELRKLEDNDPINAQLFDSLMQSTGTLLERVAKKDLVIPDFERFKDEVGKSLLAGKRGAGG